MRQPSNNKDKIAITKHSRHQYTGSAVLEIKHNDFEKLTERLAISFQPDAIITGGFFVVEEPFEKGSITLGDKEAADCYLGATSLATKSVKPLKVQGNVMDTLCDLMITADSKLSGVKGKAILIVNYVGLNKSDWIVGNTDE